MWQSFQYPYKYLFVDFHLVPSLSHLVKFLTTEEINKSLQASSSRSELASYRSTIQPTTRSAVLNMQIINTVLLAALAVQPGSASPPRGRYVQHRHQRRQYTPSAMPSQWQSWTGLYGNSTNVAPGSGLCGASTTTSTQTVVATAYRDSPSPPAIITTAQSIAAASASYKAVTTIISSAVQLTSAQTLSSPSVPVNSAPVPLLSPPSKAASSTSVQPSSFVLPATTSIAPLSIASPGSACSSSAYTPTNYTAMPAYLGLNVVNTKPYASGTPNPGFKQPQDWDVAFEVVKRNLPSTNAVRMYSTTDSAGANIVPHLMNALPAAQRHGLKILAGLWSGGLDTKPRFEQERAALEDVVNVYGCEDLIAVGVGNEDLNNVNKMGLDDDAKALKKSQTANLLIEQMTAVRKLLRQKGCCSTPVTHVDTWNELWNLASAWVPKLIQATDQAVIVNNFPFWDNASVIEAWDMLTTQTSLTNFAANEHSRALWLGESGWPRIDAGHHNEHGTSPDDAQDYFNLFGCQFLHGNGTAFYYVDWDEDKQSGTDPSFGLFKASGEPYFNTSCSDWKPDTRVKAEYPGWLGGQGM